MPTSKNSSVPSADVSTASTEPITGDLTCLKLSPSIVHEVDNYLSQLNCKKELRDEADNGRAASILSGPEVSKVMETFFGKDKKDLSVDTRTTLKNLATFYKELLQVSKTSGGSKAKEILNELFHNPEHVVFHQLLCNDPNDWGGMSLPILQDAARKKVLVEQLERDIKEIQLKKRELSKHTGLAKKELEALKTAHKNQLDKLSPDNCRRVKIGLESYKAEADKLEAAIASHNSVPLEDVNRLLEDYGNLKIRHDKSIEELRQISFQNCLPPNLDTAEGVLKERQSYLDALVEQLSNSLDFSRNSRNSSSFNNSVFSSSK